MISLEHSSLLCLLVSKWVMQPDLVQIWVKLLLLAPESSVLLSIHPELMLSLSINSVESKNRMILSNPKKYTQDLRLKMLLVNLNSKMFGLDTQQENKILFSRV